MRKSILILLFTSFIISCSQPPITECPEENSKRPSQAINYGEVASMFKTYDNGQKKVLDEYIINRTRGKDSVATVSIFFKLDELKQYIAYVERLSKEKEIELTGIRIFNAAYPSDYEKEEYQDRTTSILFPTTNIGDKKDIAYEPLQSGFKKPVSMQSVLNKFADNTTKKVNRASLLPITLQGPPPPSSGLNRGDVSPPY
jgi:hypothetical protein